ncbi:hypothetical protein H4S08_000773 [Coemansia sp. RSA 1365]|nr:hypothetical protein H4S08_000773 [Coemansia sp. RSA 1365]
MLFIRPGVCGQHILSRSAALTRTAWGRTRLVRSGSQLSTPNTAGDVAGGAVIFEALSGNPIRMLKFMSLTGTVIACTATTATLVLQSQGLLEDDDLSLISLLVASAVSATSTLIINKAFGPFVTKITLLPTSISRGIKLDKHGLPSFDSMLSSAGSGSPGKATRPLLSGTITNNTELLMESPGIAGFNTRRSQVRVKDLVHTTRRFRTWDLAPAVIKTRKDQGIRTPVTTFTILWRSLENSPRRKIMEEINNMVAHA